LKEREELGCYRLSIGTQCDDENSVFVKNTKMQPSDTEKELKERLLSIISYHEKSGVWKRCVILATIQVVFAYIILKSCPCNNATPWIFIHIVFITVMYFFFNYINYHHFRILKKNGTDIINKLVP
jgi:hypothetical protein